LWEMLPYNSLQNHALVSGDHLYHLVPSAELIYTHPQRKTDRTKTPDGTLFLSQLQHLAIKYGRLSEYLSAAPVGYVVPEHLPLLREVGRACWNATYCTKEIVEVRVRRKGAAESASASASASAYRLPRLPCDGHPEVQALVARIHEETERVWIQPPREIEDLHRGVVRSGAGSYAQYFSTLVFLNGETRPLGYCALNGLVRLSQSDSFSLDALREMTPNFVRTPAEFLGYCGLSTLWDFVQEMMEALPLLQTKAQYHALVGTLALYANVLNTWNLQYFPWHHGAEYPGHAARERVRADVASAALSAAPSAGPSAAPSAGLAAGLAATPSAAEVAAALAAVPPVMPLPPPVPSLAEAARSGEIVLPHPMAAELAL
ncbi:MAG TPA: hypothetical protein VFZ61_10265, partial [Polyangiales bacterium]